MKSVVLFCVFGGRGLCSLPETKFERLADKCIPNMSRHTHAHMNTYTHTESRWNDADEHYEC